MIVTDLNDLDQAIEEVGPGGLVTIEGQFERDRPYLITRGGAPGNPVTVSGGRIRGDRADPWTPGAANGDPAFQLGPGADWLTFSDQTFENVGNGCWQIGAPLTGLTFEHFSAHNIQRVIENRIVAGQTDASISGLRVHDGVVTDFSKGMVRLAYATHAFSIAALTGTAVVGDDFPIGVHLAGPVHHGWIEEVHVFTCRQIRGDDEYWNGDGFASEEGTSHLTFLRCAAYDGSDSAFDLKGGPHFLYACHGEGNKRDFRLWGEATLASCKSVNPVKAGGTGTQAHVHTTSDARVDLYDFEAQDCDPATIVFDADQASTMTVHTAKVTRAEAARLVTTENHAAVSIDELEEVIC